MQRSPEARPGGWKATAKPRLSGKARQRFPRGGVVGLKGERRFELAPRIGGPVRMKARKREAVAVVAPGRVVLRFGGRHELYEINYGGSTEEIRRYVLFGAMASGTAKNLQGLAEQCMAEYDLDGWKVPDLMDPDELSYHVIRSAGTVSPQIAHELESASKTKGG